MLNRFFWVRSLCHTKIQLQISSSISCDDSVVSYDVNDMKGIFRISSAFSSSGSTKRDEDGSLQVEMTKNGLHKYTNDSTVISNIFTKRWPSTIFIIGSSCLPCMHPNVLDRSLDQDARLKASLLKVAFQEGILLLSSIHFHVQG